MRYIFLKIIMQRFWQGFSAYQIGGAAIGNDFNLLGLAVLIAMLAWSLAWKGVAIWRAARAGHRKWFIVLLVLNTFGILEILYIFVFGKRIKPADTAAENTGL